MSVKEIKAEYKWRKDYSPLIIIDHCVVTAFVKQHIFTINFLNNMLWFEFHFSYHLTSFKIGVGSVYFIIGAGTNG